MQDFMQNSGNRKLSQKYNNLNGKKYMLPVAFALNHEILIKNLTVVIGPSVSKMVGKK